jgi:surface polysaccharide O-acyltransferase-like enzyme
MQEMNEEQKRKWHQKRKMGKSKYLLVYGVLLWSLSLTVFFGAIEFLTQGEVYTSWIPIRLILFATLGFFISNARWQSKERQYESAASSLSEERP